MKTTHYDTIETPIGELLLVADSDGLTGIYMEGHKGGAAIAADWTRAETPPLAAAKTQLREYFAGTRETFDLPLSGALGTPFQRRVWAELVRIPFGETATYGELARSIGDANASRAVGMANGRNPLSIVVPCHRVVGASGKLVGYAGGTGRKGTLLAHERAVRDGGGGGNNGVRDGESDGR